MSLKTTVFSLIKNPAFLILAVFITLIKSAGAEVIFQEDKNNFISLIEKPSETMSEKLANQHPFVLHERDIAAILSAIQVDKDKNSSTPLFSSEQVALLATHLPKALRQANAQQDVIFALSKNKRYLAGLKTQTYYVAGSIFIENNRLNILIGEYDKVANKAYEMAYDPTSLGLVKYDFNFGDRDLAKFSFSTPLSFSASGFNLKTKGRYDWVIAPTQLAIEGAEAGEKLLSSNKENVSRNEIKSMSPTFKEDEIISRFKRLEALKDAKLISIKEYNEKRQKLLDQL